MFPRVPLEITGAFITAVVVGSAYADHHLAGMFVPLVILLTGILLRRHTHESDPDFDTALQAWLADKPRFMMIREYQPPVLHRPVGLVFHDDEGDWDCPASEAGD